MLTLESLREEADRRGMPKGKLRGILREYLQVLMLKNLYKSRWQNRFFFLGGTSLRLLYDLQRFSEDLDFNIRDMEKKEFESASNYLKKALEKEGIQCDLVSSYRDTLYMSEFIFKGIQEHYGVADKRGEIIIKLETNKPDYTLETETEVIEGFGEIFIVNTMSRGSVFADKIDTLRNKKRGRHLYDIIFMLSKKFPVNKKLLRIQGIREEPCEAIQKIIDSIPRNQLKKLSEDVKPFLFDETESRLIENAPDVTTKLSEKYKNHKKKKTENAP